VVSKDGLRGYISAKTGEVIAEPQYKYAWINGENSYLAANIDTLGKLGFIDIRTGKTIILHKFDCYVGDEDSYFEYVFHDNLCTVRNYDGKYGFIDTLGNEVLPMLYDEIDYRMNNGFIKVTNDEYVGLLDFNTKETVLSIEYDYISFNYASSDYEEDDEDNEDVKLVVNLVIVNRNDSTFLLDRNLKQKMALGGTWRYIEELDNGYIKADNDNNCTCIFDKRGNEIYSSYEEF
jgi:hypothetical protein